MLIMSEKKPTTWNTVIDILRLGTPVLLSLLAYLFLGFQSTLQENTKAVNELSLKLAVINERVGRVEIDSSSLKLDIIKNRADIDTLKTLTQKTSSEVDFLKERIIKIEKH